MQAVKGQTQKRAALQIAVKTGVLRRCKYHWYYLNAMNDDALEHAFRLGNFLISRMAKPVRCFKGNRQRLAQAILRCRDKAGTICPHCAHEAKEGWNEHQLPALQPH